MAGPSQDVLTTRGGIELLAQCSSSTGMAEREEGGLRGKVAGGREAASDCASFSKGLLASPVSQLNLLPAQLHEDVDLVTGDVPVALTLKSRALGWAVSFPEGLALRSLWAASSLAMGSSLHCLFTSLLPRGQSSPWKQVPRRLGTSQLSLVSIVLSHTSQQDVGFSWLTATGT